MARLTPISKGLVAVLVLVVAMSVGVATATAGLRFSQLGVDLTNGEGTFARQAGSHPDFAFNFALPVNSETVREGSVVNGPPSSVKNVELALPPGMYANAANFPTCSITQLTAAGAQAPRCPNDTQVGTVTPDLIGLLGAGEPFLGLFNIEHGPGVPARFGFKYFTSVVTISAHVRPGDYGISSASVNTTQAVGIQSVKLNLWGYPASSLHDRERYEEPVGPTEQRFIEIAGELIPSTAPKLPFFTLPGSCSGAAETFEAGGDSWEEPEAFDVRRLDSDEAGTPFVWEGCGQIPFQPDLSVGPTSSGAAEPSGLQVDFKVPQNEAPEGLSASNVRSASVQFPVGVKVSPSSASGLGACSEAQIGIGSNDPPTCPESSTLGTVEIKSPLLDEELEGSLFLAKQKENPFGSLLAVYMAVKGPGFYLKLPGKGTIDQGTGQLTVSFDNTPQLPFEELKMSLKTGPRAALETPSACGTYAIQTEVTPWSGTATVKGESKFTISSGCNTGGFKPGFKAGTAKPQAGSFSPFNLQVTQASGESNLSRLKATLPPGLLAKLAGVPLCGNAEAASGNCPAGSQVGTTTIGAGPGPNPIYVPEAGKAPTAVYLGGPYKGAPYSLIVKVPAQAGPFDLGTVVVRNALNIDPFTTQVTAESDPLPQILEGIPISYRDVRVEINRPEFTVNPTNCSQFQVASVLTSASGQTSSPSAPFAAANCEGLGFEPGLKLQLKGATKRTGRPALKAVLTYPSKGSFANIARAQVNLPKSLFLEQNALNKTCTKPVLLAGNCPASTVYGKAKAWSPLLERPLEGNVYLVGGFGYKLPALVADLNGQIHVLLASKVDSGPNKGLRTTFEAVPDAPVSRFVLEMKGGKKYGLLINSENLCKGSQQLKAAFTGQNGATDEFEQKIVAGCGGKKSKSKAKPNHKKKGK
jgi:hypothetical protein